MFVIWKSLSPGFSTVLSGNESFAIVYAAESVNC